MRSTSKPRRCGKNKPLARDGREKLVTAALAAQDDRPAVSVAGYTEAAVKT